MNKTMPAGRDITVLINFRQTYKLRWSHLCSRLLLDTGSPITVSSVIQNRAPVKAAPTASGLLQTVIVGGDQDLLVLYPLAGIPILPPATFLRMFDAEQG